jgi:hypothetical protein
MADETLNVPRDLSLITKIEDLEALQAQVTTEFDRVNTLPEQSQKTIELQTALTHDLDRIAAELSGRKERARVEAEAEKFHLEQQGMALHARVHGPSKKDDASTAGDGTSSELSADAIAAAAARGTTEALVAALGSDNKHFKRASLADARRHVPTPNVPKDSELSVTASVDIPGVSSGKKLTFEGVVEAFQKRARALPVSNNGRPDSGPRICTINRRYDDLVDDRTSPAVISELLKKLTRPEAVEALVAGGGWCAPNENLYNFFNAVCVDGLIDLPTIGISRGGINWPQARSLDLIINNGFVFGNTTNPWLWTNADDVATVTGSPDKPCVRVPCPEYSSASLECYGICLTAGNLTDDAFPESTADYLRHLLAAHQHAMNARTIALMLAASGAAIAGADLNVADLPVTNQVLGAVSLAAVDYRTRYGLCDGDVLEVILPLWLRDMIRSDLAWRNAVDFLSVTDADIARMFAVRRVAPQWVGDWQVRAAGSIGDSANPVTMWPDTVDFMIYAAGTFVRGNGLTLDLGVVRDSVLNAENDHTAAWSEECHLVAQVGFASRLYRAAVSVRGIFENTPAAFADRL